MSIDLKHNSVQHDRDEDRAEMRTLSARFDSVTTEVLELLQDTGYKKNIDVMDVLSDSVEVLEQCRASVAETINVGMISPLKEIIEAQYQESDLDRDKLDQHLKVLHDFAVKIDAEFKAMSAKIAQNKPEYAFSALSNRFNDKAKSS